jgi:alpha-galactosidase
MKMKLLILLTIAFCFSFATVVAQKPGVIKNGLALTPPMGWSSWNTLKKNPTEAVIKQIADAMVATGLKDAGYLYVNVDDFWSTGRDANGKIIVDTIKFPDGMKALADYIHSKGLKAGIYTNIGSKTDYPTLASGGYYQQDMNTFAEWGYDYVKVDVNFAPVRTAAAYKKEFTEVAKAILNTGRPMVFSICNQGGRDYESWAPYIGNSWRVGPDIDHTPKEKKQWDGVIYELDLSAAHPEIAGPGHWNDADMMLVGVGSDNGRLAVMNTEEMRSHFSMWCMIASPLMLGNDLRSVSKEVLSILKNKEVIAISQDSLGMQGVLSYEQAPGLQVWTKKLQSVSGEKYAIALFNRLDNPAKITLYFNRLKLNRHNKIRDVWSHKNVRDSLNNYAFDVPGHGVKLLLIE